MRILIYTDVHFSQYSSIIRSRGKKYSTRLENLINSINWAEQLAVLEKCNAIFCLGDFFDRADLNAEETTALTDIKWSGLSHVFLCGNHELGRVENEFSTASIFQLCPNTRVINSPQNYIIEGETTELCFLPYVLNPDKSIKEYFPNKLNSSKRIVLSHNDIKGINYGAYVSQLGFDISDIEEYANLFINGHLHNGGAVTNKIINLGNFSGQNFSEDAFKYEHCIMIVDTETLRIDYYANPFAFNFYKIDINSTEECDKKLNKLRSNSVITIKCPEDILIAVKEKLLNYSNKIVESRVIADATKKDSSILVENKIEELTKLDHIKSFNEYIVNTLGANEIIQEELSEICK